MTIPCKICATTTRELFRTKVLLRHDADYFECPNCGFIQTETPHWLPEAYEKAISILDVDLVHRNLQKADETAMILRNYFPTGARFLDYGGGYGLFVRLMRDKGFDFYRHDIFCENLYAQCFDLADLPPGSKFDLVTAFEVFEHLVDPLGEVGKMLTYADSILFSTCLRPPTAITSVNDWFYFVPETGQHVSLYSPKSLKIIAEKFNLSVWSTGNLHFLSRRFREFIFPRPGIAARILRKLSHRISKDDRCESLQVKDQEYVKTILRSGGNPKT